MPNEIPATTSTAAPETGAAVEHLTLDSIAKLIETSHAGYASKINGEIAGLRRSLKGGSVEPSPAAPATPVTMEDLAASREIGRLEAQIGDSVIESLGEDYSSLSPRDQARMLRMIAKSRTTETVPATDGSRGVTPAKTQQTSRAEASAPRGAPAHPTTQTQYFEIARTSPELKKQLDADPSFHPEDLPRR